MCIIIRDVHQFISQCLIPLDPCILTCLNLFILLRADLPQANRLTGKHTHTHTHTHSFRSEFMARYEQVCSLYFNKTSQGGDKVPKVLQPCWLKNFGYFCLFVICWFRINSVKTLGPVILILKIKITGCLSVCLCVCTEGSR